MGAFPKSSASSMGSRLGQPPNTHGSAQARCTNQGLSLRFHVCLCENRVAKDHLWCKWRGVSETNPGLLLKKRLEQDSNSSEVVAIWGLSARFDTDPKWRIPTKDLAVNSTRCGKDVQSERRHMSPCGVPIHPWVVTDSTIPTLPPE